MEGKGVYRYQHGDSYEGSFLQSAPYGEGKYQYADGGYYQGEFKNLIHLNKHTGIVGAHRLPKCDGWRHGFGVVSLLMSLLYGYFRTDKQVYNLTLIFCRFCDANFYLPLHVTFPSICCLFSALGHLVPGMKVNG